MSCRSVYELIEYRVQLDWSIQDPTKKIEQLFTSMHMAMKSMGIQVCSDHEDELVLGWDEQRDMILNALPGKLRQRCIQSYKMANKKFAKRLLFNHIAHEARRYNWDGHEKQASHGHCTYDSNSTKLQQAKAESAALFQARVKNRCRQLGS